jgi:pimeloyl-ACP methyl ester carboxylesterase
LNWGLAADCAVFVAPPARFDHYLKIFTQAFGISNQTVDVMIRGFENRFSLRWNDLHPEEQAPSMRLPLLTIHDRDDRDVPWDQGRDLSDAWPDSELVTTTGLGHRRILRDPEVAANIVSFLERKSPDQPAIAPPPGRVDCDLMTSV